MRSWTAAWRTHCMQSRRSASVVLMYCLVYAQQTNRVGEGGSELA